jgi:SAM-dependent methyltransferase
MAEQFHVESGEHSKQWWLPNSLLPRVLDDIEKNVSRRCALDLACGSGRDSLYLAMRGWQVTAIDLQHDALQRLRLSAERYQLSIDTLCQNIERDAPTLARESFDLIVVVRYLHRPLLPLIAQWLKRGGYLVYQQFHSDAAAYGKPRSSAHLLRTGELNDAFRGWPVLVDEITRLDDGRPMVNFVARQP